MDKVEIVGAGSTTIRTALIVLGLFGLLSFSWASHSVTLFNGLASPLFIALATYLLVLGSIYKVVVHRRSLLLFFLFSAWLVFSDARSCEFLPALAMDSHWLILPLATLLITQLFTEYPIAFQVVRIGAALCIINLLLTLYVEAKWHVHWHYPPIFGHIRHLGLSVGLLTVLLFAKDETTGWVSLFFRCCRILGLALVFWSGTRASVLAWACCMVVFGYADRAWVKTLLIDILAGIVLSFVPEPAFPGGAGIWQRSLGAASADELSSGRLALWQSALSGLNDIERLWAGVGGNGFARLQVLHGIAIQPPGHVQAHNVIVQSICDWGIVGLALFSAFSYTSTFGPIWAERKHNDPTALAAVLYLIVTGMLDATLYHLEHLIYLAIALAYLISQKPARQTDKDKLVIPAAFVIAAVLGLAMLHAITLDYRIGLPWYFPTR